MLTLPRNSLAGIHHWTAMVEIQQRFSRPLCFYTCLEGRKGPLIESPQKYGPRCEHPVCLVLFAAEKVELLQYLTDLGDFTFSYKSSQTKVSISFRSFSQSESMISAVSSSRSKISIILRRPQPTGFVSFKLRYYL